MRRGVAIAVAALAALATSSPSAAQVDDRVRAPRVDPPLIGRSTRTAAGSSSGSTNPGTKARRRWKRLRRTRGLRRAGRRS